jgi:LPS-assembly lipoprotein
MLKSKPVCKFLGIAVVGLLLSACGFEPLLGQFPASAGRANLSEIRVETIPDRSGQLLRNHLVDAFGSKLPSRYTLTIQLREPRQILAVRRDDVISRSGYTATASFSLAEVGGKSIFAGTSTYTTDYEIANSEFATIASRDNARDRTLELVSADIRAQIAVFFRNRADGL